MNNPLVSIVIPTYNREQYIFRAITSAINQSYKNIEIIVCDNASSDRTELIVRDIIANNPKINIKYIKHSENIGPVRNWFAGIKEASGEFVKILFSDDYLFKDSVDTLLRAIDNTNYAFSYGKVENLWEGSKVTNCYKLYPFRPEVTMKEYVMGYFSPVLSFSEYPNSPCAALMRTNVLRQIPFEEYTNTLGLDVVESGIGPDLLMFLYSFYLTSDSAIYVNKKVAAFEGHKESITIASGIEKLDRHFFSTLLKFYHQLPPNNMKNEFEKHFDRLSTKPSYYIHVNNRIELLNESGYYLPKQKKYFYPLFGSIVCFFRKLIRFIEYRYHRITKIID